MKTEDLVEKEKRLLLSSVFNFMIAYLLGGYVNEEITAGFNVEGAKDLNLKTALKIRFLLDTETEKFLKSIPNSLRRIKTEVSREKYFLKGTVKGKIDWKKTIQTWSCSGFVDRTGLHVSLPIKDYDIPENLVLKKTISILNDFMNDPEVHDEIRRGYSWSERLAESSKYVKEVLRNIHFRRIKEAKNIQITPRMKSQVLKSRQQLYRDSCKVFYKYQKVFLKNDLDELLEKTFIDPDNIEKTFELLCLFSIIEILNKKMNWDLKHFAEIKEGRQETAILSKNNFEIKIFYNVTGELEFFDKTEPSLIKQEMVRITHACFGKKTRDNTRRPDIILELVSKDEKDRETTKDYTVIEVKYTKNEEYIIQGISQALHYLWDLKKKNKYFFKGTLGKAYNAAVIAREIKEEIKKESHSESAELAVKLFDFNDLVNDDRPLHNFLSNFLEKNEIINKA